MTTEEQKAWDTFKAVMIAGLSCPPKWELDAMMEQRKARMG